MQEGLRLSTYNDLSFFKDPKDSGIVVNRFEANRLHLRQDSVSFCIRFLLMSSESPLTWFPSLTLARWSREGYSVDFS